MLRTSAEDVAAPGSTIPCTYSVTTLGTTATSPRNTAPVVPSIEIKSPSRTVTSPQVKNLSSIFTSILSVPQTAGRPIPRATTAA